MSRCFPFPPPGYEKKPTLDDSDLLKKEKRKEKKHKKDREKKEKEKKEDRSENKNKEKKDKKDKHKDKKKDRDKSSAHLRNGEHKEHLLRKEESVKENEQLSIENKIKSDDTNNAKFVQELSRRIRDDEKQTGTTLQFPIEIKKSNVDRSEIPKINGRMSIIENKIDAKTPPLNKEKSREKEKDEKRKKKDRDKEKGRSQEEKVKEKNELFTKTEKDKNRYTKNIDTIGSCNNLSTHSPNVNVQCAASDLKKRKHMETNGFSHENEPRPNKTARSTSSILTVNGRKLDCPELSLPSKHVPSIGTFKVDNNNNNNNNNINKERKFNGIIASQPMTLVSKNPPITTPNHTLRKPTPSRSPPPVPTTKPPYSVPNHIATPPGPVSKPKPPPVANNKVAAQPWVNYKKKPPHPDTKYLKQILEVPKLEIWSGEDDQQWLFSSKNNRDFEKIIGDDSLRDNNENIEVWSEAKHLESVDIYALPYVIPY